MNDYNKAKIYLNWQSIWGFEKTIKFTANWYKNFYERKNNLNFSIKQIQLYLKEINENVK